MAIAIPLKAQSNLARSLFLKTTSSKFLLSVEKKNNINMFLPSIKHTAFFCVMEDKVYSKLNVWIKLRAGSDEIYRKMVAIP